MAPHPHARATAGSRRRPDAGTDQTDVAGVQEASILNRIEQFLGVPAKQNDEIGQEVAEALNKGSEATRTLFKKYDAESIALGMHFMGIMAKAQVSKERKTISVPKHPERN